MSKRDTRGRPQKQRTLSNRPISRAEQDYQRQRLVLLIAGGVTVFIVILLVLAIVNETVVVPSQAISEVNGVEIKTRDFQERVKAERWITIDGLRQYYEETGDYDTVANQIALLDRDPLNIGARVLDDMELQILLEAEAKARSIEVDEAAIQAQVDEFISNFTGVSTTPTPTTEPTAEPSATWTPILLATATLTPSITPTETVTPLPPVEGCQDPNDCPTVTPLPTATASNTPTETPTATPTDTPISPEDAAATQERFEARLYNTADEEANIDRDVLRDIFYLQALRDALKEAVTNEQIENGELLDTRVKATTRHILISVPQELQRGYSESLCESEDWQPYAEKAQQVLDLLNSGEPFAAVAFAMSDDSGSAVNGGMLGETTDADNAYVEPFAKAVRNSVVGEYVGPVCSQFGFHIIQVLSREITPIPEAELESIRENAYREWELDLTIGADIQRRTGWEDRVPETPKAEDILRDIIDENE
ncbi:MAG: hypothetical protein CUN55_11300 [Phototrophicales bacterium]|nr:MAG: hypothetical protein CUN55_11300 [Phototrophicales bacterium]